MFRFFFIYFNYFSQYYNGSVFLSILFLLDKHITLLSVYLKVFLLEIGLLLFTISFIVEYLVSILFRNWITTNIYQTEINKLHRLFSGKNGN